MSSYKILILTDHRSHSDQNSIYTLLRALAGHPACSVVDVASRGNPRNDSFFQDGAGVSLFASRVQSDFAFSEGGRSFAISRKVALPDYDAILLRLPAPVPDRFWHFLEEATRGQVVINRPAGILRSSDKSYLLELADLCPPMRLLRSREEIEAFLEHFPIVLKPLRGYGGKGVIRLEKDRAWQGAEAMPIAHFWTDYERNPQPYLGMQFLKNVDQGDKRIVVIDGEAVGASLRLPPEGAWLCNAARGGSSTVAWLEEEERQMVQVLSERLRPLGVIFFGIDTLVGDDEKRVLSEVNTMSIGGILQIAGQNPDQPVLEVITNRLIQYIDSQIKQGYEHKK